MATFLYRLGRFSYRRRGLVALLWVGLLVLFGVGAGTLHGPTSNDFSIPGTEAQRAIDLLKDKMPQASADGATARVVIRAPAGHTLAEPQSRAAVEQVVGKLRTAPQVGSVVDPYQAKALSQDQRTALTQVTYKVTPVDVKQSSRDALDAVAKSGRDAGLTVEMGGSATQGMPEQGASELIGLAIAAVVLLITLGSLVAAGLPLLNAILGVAIAMAGITAATGFVDMSSTTSTLALMLGLAVAIDYALFITSRYRHELAEGRSGEEAAGRAVGTAGSAVVFAGLTVVIALVGLSVVGIPVLTEMGIAAGFAVVVAVLIALVLLPALLGFAGRSVLGGRIPGLRGGPKPGRAAAGERWARFVVRRPLAVLLVSVVGLGALALPALGLRLGMPGEEASAASSTQHKAYDMVSEGFGPGFNGPLMVVVHGSGDVTQAAGRLSGQLKGMPDVAAVTPPVPNQARDTALLTVVPKSGPSTKQTEDLVSAIRDKSDALKAQTGAEAMVTGQTAIGIDISAKLAGALPIYLALVVGLAFILLMLVFRSVLVPLKATLGFLLTVAATFGVVVAVFQKGWGWGASLIGVDTTGPIMSLMPIFMIGVVFGLAMDYQVFLVTRMREEYVHGAAPTDAVVAGFRHGARVVAAAAVIMMAVFAGFISNDQSMIKLMGFALAAGVFFDAFVVRMTVVPAVMALFGKAAWWLPRWLARVLPNVDVEGEKLRHLLEDAPSDVQPDAPSDRPREAVGAGFGDTSGAAGPPSTG
ncbi:MMPL family transporter [Actinomadura rupiterrae]|uniref:MMPL family transporter n=1 Tax=Actinomadura rupiterrae TaxID=559627 RepID=UPI0020A429C4|nr:MMPL family transporter [Actinomadura rupiterrae]MCP2341658.1 RND superfamily putative drug exporter [Actinomadura rupiterrae]